MTNNGHGGNVYAAARALRKPLGKLFDFSASINPLGPSPKASRAIANGRDLVSHYPDPDSWALKRALAARWKLEPTRFLVGNGSTELIDLLPRALAVRRALIIGPTFSEYACAMARAGGRSTMLPAQRHDDYRPPLDGAIEWLRPGQTSRRPIDAIFLCNPNSPTGQACNVTDLLALVRAAERLGIWTIVDETFVEYREACSVLSRLPRYSRLIVLRSFTKFYGLPGLRIGYLAASEQVVRLVSERQPPWSVNALAQVAAEAAFSDRDHARRSLLFMEKERDRLTRRLSSIAGLTLFPSQANFLLAELPKPHRADLVTSALRRQGILIRDCSLVPGLNRRTVRVAVRSSRENDRLVEAFHRSLE